MEGSPSRSVELLSKIVPFGCTVERGSCTAWVQPTGELDLLTSPLLQRHLREALAEARLVVLDLRQLTFIDASGVHVICDASENADAEERRLMVIRGLERVHRVFTLTGLSEKLTVFDVARREGNLIPLKPARRACGRRNTTEAGRGCVDGTTPATRHANNGSTPRVHTGS